jgi:CHAT domain-containing protein
MSEKEKLQFWTDVRPNFESFDAFCSVYFSFKPEIVSYMYNNVLATKGLILSSTKKVLSKIRQSKDTSVTNVLNRWQDTKDFWLLLTQNPEKAKEYKVSIDSIADLANELEKELSSKSEDFKNAFSAKEITWQDVQKTLKPGEAAIELVRFRNEGANDNPNEESIFYAALIVKQNTKNYPEITIINNGSELEDNYVKLYGNLVKILKIQPISERTPLEMELLESDQKDLYKQFWGRVNDKLKGIKKVYLSLDGVYNSINLMTLVNPQTSKYLIEELDLRIVTNTKDLIEYAKPKQKNIKNTAQLIGDPLYNFDLETEGWVPPLPGTKYEVEKISSDMIKKNWNVKTYLGKDALEQTIKSVENPKILHIATHGMFLPEMESNSDNNILGIDAQQLKENPLLRSMLLFAGVENKNEENNTNDGKLTAYEAMDLALDNTDIVVLSACETGLGEVKNGEGVYGLQRAFQVAGAKSLIMSLWTVSDEATQHLMTKFYDRILKGTNKRQAFREAQIDLKKTYPEFYYWGAFVMVGE